MSPNPQKTADLVTFTEQILTGKFNFLCSDKFVKFSGKIKHIRGKPMETSKIAPKSNVMNFQLA